MTQLNLHVHVLREGNDMDNVHVRVLREGNDMDNVHVQCTFFS